MQRYWWSVMLGLCIACGAYTESEWMGRVYLCPISGQCRDRVYPCPTGGQPQGLSLQTGGKGWFDSLNVRFVGNWPFGTSRAVAFDSARSLAFCGSGGGVYILDLSTPANPIKISDRVRTRGFVSGLFYDEPNKRLYIAAGVPGLEIWDITDPSTPYKLSSLDTPGWALGVAVSGSYAYIADRWDGLRIIDILNPVSPTEVGFYDTPGYARGVAVSASYAYIADDWEGLRIIDISDPASPTEVGFYDTPGWAWGVAVSASYAYIADGSCGLQIYENLLIGIEEDENYELGIMNYELSVHPNPFRGSVRIAYSVMRNASEKHSTPHGLRPTLGIYDLAGRLVKRFTVHGSRLPGMGEMKMAGILNRVSILQG